MKKRYLFLPVAAMVLLFAAGYVAKNAATKKICEAGKNCPLKQKKQTQVPEGSSPDEIHFSGLNRLIVSISR